MTGLDAMADTAIAPPAARRRLARWIYVGPALIVCIGVIAAIQIASYIDDAAVARDADRFSTASERALDRLTDRMTIQGTLLRGVAALLRAAPDQIVSPDVFAAYLGRLNIDLNYPGVQGIGYSMVLRDDASRQKVFDMLVLQRAPTGLWADHASVERFALVLVYPPDPRNRATLGYDLSSDAVRRSAVERARDEARPVLTARVTLVADAVTDRQPGFLMYAPVYFGDGVPDTVDARRSRFVGAVVSGFRARDLLSTIFTEDDVTRELSVALYDGPTASADALLYRTDPDVAGPNPKLRAELPVMIAGQPWTAIVTARAPFYRHSAPRLAQGVLAAGVIGSIVLAGLALAQAQATVAAEQARDQVRSLNQALETRIAARTRELEFAREALIATNMDLETTVARRTLQLRDSIQEAQRFVYVASHDLRAPLVNIVGFTGELATALQRLKDFVASQEEAGIQSVPSDVTTAIREDIPEALDFIRASTSRMDRLINAILRLAREERRTLTPEIVPLDALLHAVADGLKSQLNTAGAELVIESPLPEIVGDRLSIEQVVANLIENAVKYLDPARPGHILVRGRDRGTRIELEVTDNGRGIDPRDHERIFELFRRAGQQDTDGEGIGLAHVRALVRRMDGSIAVVSRLGEGAKFTVDLPKNLVVTEGAA